ncbi:YitT family protein, partial [Bacillus cereus group sp. Bce025]
PIGIGTILTVCLGGLLLNFFMPLTKKVLDYLFVHQSTSPSYKSNKVADHNDNKSIF